MTCLGRLIMLSQEDLSYRSEGRFYFDFNRRIDAHRHFILIKTL